MIRFARSTGGLAVAAVLVLAAACSKKPAAKTEPEPTPTPSVASTPVPVTAAPTPRPTPVPAPSILSEPLAKLSGYLNPVFFDLDKADIRPDAKDVLGANAEFLRKYPTIKVTVEGHCDERGTREYNMALGQRRASSAKEYLISLGIDGSRLDDRLLRQGAPLLQRARRGLLAEEPARPVHGDGQVTDEDDPAKRPPRGPPRRCRSATGCVTTSDIEGIHKHLNELEKKVDAASAQASSREEVQKLNENLSKQANTLLRSNADLGTKFDELVREMQSVAGKLEESNRRLREVSQQMAEVQARAGAERSPEQAPLPPRSSSRGCREQAASTAGAGAPRAARSPSPSDLFAQATADYQRGQFDLARQGFAEYAETYPKTDLSDDALYWAGECWAAQKKSREAIAAWERLFKQYPDSDKAAAAHLKKAIAHLDLGEKAQAIVELQFVVNEYPRSDEAKSARQRLKALGSDVR